MADIISCTPTSMAGQAMFNWPEFGIANFKYSGTINVSISNCFTPQDYVINPNTLEFAYSDTNPLPVRSQLVLDNIDSITRSISKFGNIQFSKVVDYATLNPAEVGAKSNINIITVSRSDVDWAGVSSISNDEIFGYSNAKGDVSINLLSGYGSWDFSAASTYGDVLMHEIGHSLGMTHPFSDFDYTTGSFIYTTGFSSTVDMGFSKLGFHINSAADMDKSYFTMMSYDQQYNGANKIYYLTPMILDVLAFQNVYGEGSGTSDALNSTISLRANNYNSYFDLGGNDTINLAAYDTGAYLNMGTTIFGASHLVGVAMTYSEGMNLINNGTDPDSLNWLVGEYENAVGSSASDRIIGNSLNNSIWSGAGDDYIEGGNGNDFIDGGIGTDIVHFNYASNTYKYYRSGDRIVVQGYEGRDILANVEKVQFGTQSAVLLSTLTQNIKYTFTQSDFNGDGNSDIMWWNKSTNQISTWLISNGKSEWSLAGQAASNLTFAGTGDFNRNGTMDVLWQDPTTNSISLWTMSNGSPTYSNVGTGSTTMNIAGIGDFNGDGTSDILWQNPTNNLMGVWSMQNGQAVWSLIGQGSTTMKVAGIGDFNGDGIADILWQNPTNNLLGVWSMKNNQPSWSLIGQGSTTMNVAGFGDFNGDGTTDILWLNPTNNLVGVWSMTNNQPKWSLVGQGSTTMSIASIGDYNADGTSDVLWFNSSNGMVGTWTMNNNVASWSLTGSGSNSLKIV